MRKGEGDRGKKGDIYIEREKERAGEEKEEERGMEQERPLKMVSQIRQRGGDRDP